MKNFSSFLFFIWSIFFVFHKEALCKDGLNSPLQKAEVKDQPVVKKFSTNEILGLGMFEAPEEKLFDMLPGETFYLPKEPIQEPDFLSVQVKPSWLNKTQRNVKIGERVFHQTLQNQLFTDER